MHNLAYFADRRGKIRVILAASHTQEGEKMGYSALKYLLFYFRVRYIYYPRNAVVRYFATPR